MSLFFLTMNEGGGGGGGGGLWGPFAWVCNIARGLNLYFRIFKPVSQSVSYLSF